jgi:hypothetical protein
MYPLLCLFKGIWLANVQPVIGRMEIAAYAVIVSQTYVFVNDGVWMVGCGQHGKQLRTYDGDSAESKSFRGTPYKRPFGTELKVALGLATADAESDEVAIATVRCLYVLQVYAGKDIDIVHKHILMT